MPAFPRHHQHPVVQPLRIAGQPIQYLGEDRRLGFLTAGIEALDIMGKELGFLLPFTQEQLRCFVRRAHPPRRVDAGRQGKYGRRGGLRLTGHPRDLGELPEPQASALAQHPQAPPHQRAVFPPQGHHIRERPQGHQIGIPLKNALHIPFQGADQLERRRPRRRNP